MRPDVLALPGLAELADIGSLTRVLLDRMTEGVSLAREDGTILYTNPAQDALFGYASGELLGRHVSVLNAYPAEENARIVAEVMAELRRTGAWQGDWRNRRKDGSEFLTRSRISGVEIGGERHWLSVQEDITEREASARALREERARLQVATAAGGIGIWDWDIRARRLTVSPQVRAIYGLSDDEEDSPESLMARIHPDDLDRIRNMAGAAMIGRQRSRQVYEHRLLWPDGTLRWVQGSGEVLFEEGPEGRAPVRYLGTVQDITARRALEDAERDAAQRLRLAIEAGRMVVWDLDIATDRVAPSPALSRVLGFPEDEPLDLGAVRARYHPGEEQRLQAESRAAMQRGETSFESAFLYRHPDGSDRRLRLRCEIAPGPDGAPARAIGVLSDETESWRTEEALRASEEHLRHTVELNPQVPWTCDPQGNITSYSRRWLDLTGQAPDEPLGDGWSRVVHPDDLPATLEIFTASLRSGTPVDVEYRIRIAASGAFHWMRARAYPLRNDAGAILRWYGVVEDVHDRKLAELQLRESEALLAGVIRHAPVGIILAEAPSGRAILGNDQVDLIFRRPFRASASVSDYDDYEGYDPATGLRLAPRDWPLARAILAGETVLGQEIEIARGDGTRGVISVSASPIRDAAGRVVAGSVSFEDITERKANDEALRHLNNTLEAEVAQRTAERDRIWSISRDLMCVTAMDGTLLSVNPAWERLLGWSPDWLRGRKPGEIRHPDDAAGAMAELRTLALGESTLGYEARYRHRDGGWRWISWTIEPEGDRLYCIGRDITAEKETRAALEAAEAARREADALYRAYFESSAEALFVIRVGSDGGFAVEQVNATHAAQVGYDAADIHGRRIEELIPPEIAARVTDTYRQVVETGHMLQFRDSYEMPGGVQHWDTSLVPIRDPEGRVVRIFGSGRNVTAQVQAEDALRQAQKMEAVGQLTGGIAHDFNNLLGALVGSLDLIRRRPDDADRVRRFAEAGIQAAERGAKLTGQLLAFSRSQRLETRPVAVASLVRGLRDLLGRTLGPMIRLSLDLACEDAVLSDQTQLEMALLNLAINARDAMPDGGELGLSTALRVLDHDPELAPGDYVELAVADGGTGMPPEVAARALDPFFTTKGVGKGTGLGLSQVYGIARQAGGTVRLETAPGQGTTVRVLLPRTDLAPETAASTGRDEDAPGPARARVLLIDDDPDVRRMIAASLDALGYRVEEAEDGPQGLVRLEQAAPDLLLVDFAMPGLNGAEVAAAAWVHRPGLPVVFVSGYSDTARIEAVAGPRALVLRKPFRVDELQAILVQALGGAS
ncbi:PAS domain S-box protein [Rubellimicrobium roseum]|uniref:histidine kinase n=1 Tax=Rubellimicrobium roseum TaxID=687525 RepID=A0A5C4N8S3_9RHOB|nr:PAS domain S-box protein [Rubellimicrobium roseum]TNC70902.1 PAS domain S-box protein [Rubellimicrobium roseum]